MKITNKVEQGRKGTGSREILKKSGKKIFFYSIKKETENSKFTKDFHSCYSMRIIQFEKWNAINALLKIHYEWTSNIN